MVIYVNDKYFKKVVSEICDGITIMDAERKIIYINKNAFEITGWKIGEYVPYCSYCQLREVSEDEERCILANDNPLPSFRSHMPNYVDKDSVFEMSMTKLDLDGDVHQVLIIRDPNLNRHDEEIKTQELLIQETMIAQEGERKRLARELHDHIGQSVYSIYLGLDGIKRHVDNAEYHKSLEKMTTVMEETLQNLQRLTKELRPRLFDNLSFETGLRSAVEDWRQLYKVEFTLKYQASENPSFENDDGLQLYRIIQEAVYNAVRHGKATRIKIEITKVDDELYFQITDNGQGFDPETLTGHGLGLKHMKERVKMLNGDIKWISQKGGPTRIEGYVPLLSVKSE